MQQPFDYIAEANATASNNFHGNLIPLQHLSDVLRNAVEALNELDKVKKALFYGRTFDLPEKYNSPSLHPNVFGVPVLIGNGDPKRGELIFHGIIGKATECGELLELVQECLFGNAVMFDETNAIEEVGDGFWYDAILLKQLDATFEQTQKLNIAKLRHRFPNRFTEFDANNRDLFGERQILEAFGEPVKVEISNIANYRGSETLPVPPNHVFAGVNESAGYLHECVKCGAIQDVNDKEPCGSGEQTPKGQAKLKAAELGKQFAVIENWIFVGSVLVGDVREHPRLGSADACTTSRIERFDEAQNICITKNTFYWLGTKYCAKVRTPEELEAAGKVIDEVCGPITPAVDTGD